ncbi:MAG: Ig-like domain-containing protein [Lachnospiraceae bacterium]|nr:Ig-like domain-containing protein [Lachnospiraceae bacterium]
MRRRFFKLIAYIMSFVLMFNHINLGNGGTVTLKAQSATTMANVVLFIDFADTDHSAHNEQAGLLGECFLENPQTTFDLFNGSDSEPAGMKYYLSQISYGQLQVTNIFPQYDDKTGQITPFRVSGTAADYADGGSMTLLTEAVELLNASGLMTEDADLNNDGVVDNVVLVVAADNEGDKELFTSHKSSLGGYASIGDLKVNSYNLVTESQSYMYVDKSGVITHEFLHTMGYPDLYKVGAPENSTATPVGNWDIMASSGMYLQYPLAYLRSAVTGWFNIPTITSDVAGYTIYAPTSATDATKDNQAVILKTDYSDTEFFVVEYRVKDPTYLSDKYDAKVYGSGLIIYRVDIKQPKNIYSCSDMIYVFRPGDDYDIYGHEAGGGDMSKSYLSAESGRTSYGTTQSDATLSDGAITYADGTNSGILISNVGSAGGDTISFDVTFGNQDEALGGFWREEAVKTIDGLMYLDSYINADGKVYVLGGTNSGFSVYTFDSITGWTQVGSTVSMSGGYYQLIQAGDTLYVGGVDFNQSRAVLYSYGSHWTKVFTSTYEANELSLDAYDGKVYMAYPNMSGSSMYCQSYSPSGSYDYGVVGTGSYVANPCVSVYGGNPVVSYRDAFAGGDLGVMMYSQSDDSWTDLGQGKTVSNFTMKLSGDMLYLVTNGDGESDYSASNVFAMDLAAATKTWTQVGDTYISTSATPLTMCFSEDEPYLIYQDGSINETYVKSLANNSWTMVGTKVASSYVNDISCFVNKDKICVVYGDSNSGNIFIKTHDIPNVVDVTAVELSDELISLELGVDTEATLSATVTPADATNPSVYWSSSDPDIATVDTTGKVTAVAVGQATIKVVTLDGGLSDECVVEVWDTYDAPSAPVVDSKTSTSVTLKTVAGCQYSKDGKTWQDSNVFSGLKANTEYTFYAKKAASGYYKESVASAGTKVTTSPVAVTGITLDKSTAKLEMGVVESVQLSATVVPSDATNKSVTWTSNNTSAAKVDTTGKVTAVAAGKATITVKTVDGGFTKTCVVEVWDTYATPSAPVVDSKTSTSVTLQAIAGCQYSKDGKTWQDSNVFSGLKANTEYTFYVKKAASGYYKESAASEGTKVKTEKEPTTEAPTTQEPTSEAPTTEEPTTQEPTTEAPTTQEPTTEAPTTEEPEEDVFVAPEIDVYYRTHIQNVGWEGTESNIKSWKKDGVMSGTSGRALRLEGINIVVTPETTCPELDLGIQYTTHCQDYGWLPWSADGDMNGT